MKLAPLRASGYCSRFPWAHPSPKGKQGSCRPARADPGSCSSGTDPKPPQPYGKTSFTPLSMIGSHNRFQRNRPQTWGIHEFEAYTAPGTHNRFQWNRSDLRQAKRLGPFTAPTPGLFYIIKFKPGEPPRGPGAPRNHPHPASRTLQRGAGDLGPCSKRLHCASSSQPPQHYLRKL